MSRGRHARPPQTAIIARRTGVGSIAGLTLLMSTPGVAGADGMPEDEAPTVEIPVIEPPTEPIPAAEPFRLTVRQGDTLNELAPTAGAPSWQALYEQNLDVVGPNPDLIFPGQELTYVAGLALPAGPPLVVEDEPPVEEQGLEPAPVPAATQAPFGVAPIVNSAGPVTPSTQEAADRVFTDVPGASLITIGGTRGSARDPEGHPSGRALDWMVLSDARLGDAITEYHRANWDSLGVSYIIWQQRILTSPNGVWSPMEDRGSATQNHFDHVHVNYR